MDIIESVKNLKDDKWTFRLVILILGVVVLAAMAAAYQQGANTNAFIITSGANAFGALVGLLAVPPRNG